jgi:hypothetical protein
VSSRFIVAAVLLMGTAPLGAQVPSDSGRTRSDSAAQADSLRLVRALEAMQPDTTASRRAGAGPSNPRLLPDISAVGDMVGDFSPSGSTQEDRATRFGMREVEIAVQAAVDPYFKGDIYLGFSDAEGVSVEQMYLTSMAFPHQLEARLGRFLLPIGKINVTHQHDLHTVEYPWMVREFLGAEGLKGDGAMLSRVVAPLGWYQELQLMALDRFGEAPEQLVTAEPVNRRLSGLGFAARLRNYWDLGESTNLEISGSAITGKREQPIDRTLPDEVNAVAARQTLVGVDATFRWRPLQQGLYKSFIAQFELFRQMNQDDPALPLNGTAPVSYLGPTRDATGLYGFARWQFSRRGYLGARYDRVGSAHDPGVSLRAASGYLEFFPSEFSKFLIGYERILGGGASVGFDSDQLDRILVQASFALGPHKPHPF